MTDGKTNPDWVTEDILLQLKNLSNIGMSAMFDTPAKNRLTAGEWAGQGMRVFVFEIPVPTFLLLVSMKPQVLGKQHKNVAVEVKSLN